MSTMNLLITGGNGQLGTAFSSWCDKHDIMATVTDVAELDICDLSAVRHLFDIHNFTHVINCAAYTQVDKAETEWQIAYAINGTGVRNLAVIAKEQGAAVVHFSTDYVFGGEGKVPYKIVDKPGPVSRYGESKLLGEEYLADIGGNWLCIRVSWLYGDGFANFPTKLLGWAAQNETLKIVTDEVSIPTYTEDVVPATFDLLEKHTRGLYHMTGSGFCSRFEWASFILQKIGWKGRLEEAKQVDFSLPAKRPAYSVLDGLELEETIGRKLPDWQDACSRFLKKRGFGV